MASSEQSSPADETSKKISGLIDQSEKDLRSGTSGPDHFMTMDDMERAYSCFVESTKGEYR